MNKKINKKKPPDKYKTLKISFKQLIKQNIDYSNLIDAVIRTNKLTILVYQFMRALFINMKKIKTFQLLMNHLLI